MRAIPHHPTQAPMSSPRSDGLARPSTRRHALCCGAAAVAGLFTSLTAGPARAFVFNPCRGRLPPELAQHEVVQQAFYGLNPNALWDMHTHLLGTGDSGSGCSVNANMTQWWHPV